MMQNPYVPLEAKIVEVIDETSVIKTFKLKPAAPFHFKAGQFIELTIPGVGEAPFTPSSSPFDLDQLEVTIMRAGEVTGALHGMKAGDTVGIRGPFGTPYPLDTFQGKELLIVGGGVGLAPLRSLLLALLHEVDKYKKIYLRYGARTPKDIVYKYLIEGWKKQKKLDLDISVDLGDAAWTGKTGLVTNIIEGFPIDVQNAAAIVCGPPIMMKFITYKLCDLHYNHNSIYLSMEKNMSCGIGKCARCLLGKYFVCKDGPVLTWEQVKGIADPF